ncbi:MAG: DUF378 domain-containing protein [Armatimonadota bacterium]
MRRIVSFMSFILVIVGAVNWLLVGTTRFDLVRWLFGRDSLISRIVYSLVGAAGLTQLTTFIQRAVKGKAMSIALPS